MTFPYHNHTCQSCTAFIAEDHISHAMFFLMFAVLGCQAHELEQQLCDANSQNQSLLAHNKQLQQQRDSLEEQLRRAQKECQDAQTQLQDQKAAFEEESASFHTLASRHKEERASLESAKQALEGLVRELTMKAEVSISDGRRCSSAC